MEIWVPYGDVESLLTILAENLGELVDPAPEGHVEELVPILEERLKGHDTLIVCDFKPATAKVLKALSARMAQDSPIRILSPFAKRLSEAVPDLSARIVRTSPNAAELMTDGEVKVTAAAELAEDGRRKFVLATGVPDPLFGYIDARVALGLSCTSGARKLAYSSREDDEIGFFRETKAYSSMVGVCDKVVGAAYGTILTRGGEPYSMIEGGAKDAAGHYPEQQPSPAKGIVVGAGGRGYDDTFSQVLRLAMGSLKAVRKGGEIILVGECRDGIGSAALQMQSMGRVTDAMLRKGFYEDGLEEIGYLSRLRDVYSVTLLSSLPDLYVGGRFRFRSARSSAQAFEKIFSSVGRNAKLHVFTRAPETLLASPKAGG